MAISQQIFIMSIVAIIVIIIDCGRVSVSVLISSALGIAGFAILHFTAFAVPVNVITICVSVVLGLPGTAALMYIFGSVI